MYKLSKPQEAIFEMSRFSNDSVTNIAGDIFFNFPVSVDEARDTACKYFHICDTFFTQIVMVDGVPMQQTVYKEITLEDICVREFDTYSEYEIWAKADAVKPIDIFGCLYRLSVIKIGEKVGFYCVTHHIINDATSFNIMAKFACEYLQGNKEQFFYSYKEYLDAEKKYEQSPRYEKDKEYWVNVYNSGEINFLIEKDVGNKKASRKSCYINEGLSKKIKKFCENNEITEYAFFLTAIASYYSRITQKNNFFIGSPVLNRNSIKDQKMMGVFINTIPIDFSFEGDEAFSCLCSKTADNVFSAFRHQKYHYSQLLKDIYKLYGTSKKMFDVVLSFLNTKTADGAEIGWFSTENQVESLQIHIDDRRSEGVYHVNYDYQIEKFTEHDIDMLHKHICVFLADALENDNKKLCELEMLTPDEKQKLLYDFNNTKAEYPRDKCIHALFEERVEKNPDKIAVVAHDKALTYRELNEESNRIAHALIEKGIGVGDIVAFSLPRKSYLIATMIGILKAGAAYMPIDPDYPQERIEYMLEDSNAKYCVTEENVYELLDNLNSYNPDVTVKSTDICYCIYTSGSTGKPKGAMIRHNNLMNFCNDTPVNNLQHYIARECSAVLACGSIVFDISNFEIFLSLLLSKSVILANEQEVSNANLLAVLIRNNCIDCVHCTPTKLQTYFYNKEFASSFRNVKCVMVGGEQFTKDIYETIRSFSDAKIFNGYGPTETTMGVGFGEVNDDIITIGKPIANTQIYIADKHMNLVPVGVTGEICIAGDGVGAGYINNPELTAEKFIDNPFGEGKLYKTGDIGFWREDGSIVFVGRNDFQVKIRGLRIELGEIENAISAVEGINLAVAVVRKNSEGRQLICAFYTGEEKEAKDIRAKIGETLPKYMIPHIFTHLPEMPLTSSGKINRKALPEINLENIGADIEYVAPETKEEAVLIACIEDVLGIEQVSILDNFFDIGGDSLKSIELTSRLEIKGYEVQVKKIFASQDIRELAKELTVKEKAEIKVEYDSVLPATAAQMRVYTAQMMNAASTLYNVPYVFKTDALDANKLEEAVNRLIERHESLRTHFESRNGQIVQVIDEKAQVRVQKLENDDVLAFTKPFNLTKSPLIRVGYYKSTVMVDMHHIIVDGETIPVFFRELNELYMGREITEEAVQYGEFAVQETNIEESEKYWLSVFEDEVPSLDLPTDYVRKEKQSFNGSAHYDFIDLSLHEKIKYKCKELGITPYVFYMTCFNILLSKYSGNEDIVVGMPISGRSSRFIKTVGMFVNTIALRSRPEGEKTIGQLLGEIRDNSIEAIDNQYYPFGELVKKLNIEAGGRNPLYDVMLAYQSYEMTDIVFGDKKAELLPIPTTFAKNDFIFSILPRNNDVVVMVEYCTDLYKQEKIESFVNSFKLILKRCLEENIFIKDIEAINDEEKQKILYDFNDTAVEYTRDKCVHQLFEEQVKKTPDKIAVIFKDNRLSYREMHFLVQSYANKLIHLGLKEKDVVAIHLGRSHRLIAFQLATLKIGAIFLPLDKRYPPERIKYACNDCAVSLLVTDETINVKMKTKVIDINDFEALTTDSQAETIVNNDSCYIIYTSGSTGKPKGCLLTGKGLLNFCKNNNTLETLGKIEDCVFACVNSVSFDYFIAESLLPLTNGFTTVILDDNESTVQKLFSDVVVNNNINVLMTTPTRLKIYFCDKAKTDVLMQFRCICTSGEPLTAELLTQMYEKSPFAKVYNPIGPSECSVWDIGGNLKREDEIDIHIGKPIANAQIYITDKYLKPVPIGVTGEICIAGDGVGAGYINNPELTAEKFIDNPFGEGKLYKTGDIGFWREDGNIVFVGRNDFQVKIRGLRIELGEIENAISAVEGINLAVAVVRKNSEGRQLICAFYTGEEKEAKDIRAKIGETLPKYMIPHIFTHLPEMPLTSSGKINRKALPEINLENIGADIEYVAPETKEEAVLIACIEAVLGIEQVSILDNFFNIGGDSIKAIYIVSELEEAGYELHVADIMQSDTLLDIAKAIKSTSGKAIYDQEEVNGFIPFSPIMRAFLNENNTIPKDFVHTCIVYADCDEDTARKALDALVSHHDILRGDFCDNGIEIHPSSEKDVYSFKTITIDDTDKAKEYLNNISIDDNRLVNVVFCNTEKESIISITVHHFLIDLVSWEVLMKDFQTVVEQLKNNAEISLPAKTASFMLWNDALQNYSEAISEESKDYWKNINARLDNTKSLYSCNEKENEAEDYSFTLDNNISNKLINEANNTYGTRINEVLLTALGLAACKIADGSVGIIVESHGRAELDNPIAIERTVGWFTSCYPIVIDNNNNVTDELIKTKETIRRIPKNGIDYLLLSQGFHKSTDIIFNFYKSSIADEDLKNKLISLHSGPSVFPGKINVNCVITDAVLTVNVSVPKCKHKQQITKELGMEFAKQIEKLVDICTTTDTVIKTRSDFSDDELTEIELDELKDLFDWTDDDE